MHNMNN